MRRIIAVSAISAFFAWTGSATASECAGHPDALGTERIIAVDPSEHPRVGTMQYPESLPLQDKEVVLTFDDGPLPRYTDSILDTLAAECVKATFFMVGRMAHAFPAEARKVYNAGHTVASHSETHPIIFTRLPVGGAQAEIDRGAASVSAALGDPRALSPFFRFPGLGRSHAIEAYLQSRGMMTWSADFPADDWTHISGQEVMKRALERLERRGRGILLLHDIQPATALMLPQLLRELKARGFHVVQVVAAGPERPKTVTEPETWVFHKPKPVWPTVLERSASAMPAPSLQSFGWPRPFRSRIVTPLPIPPSLVRGLAEDGQTPPARPAVWTPAQFLVPTTPIATFKGFGELPDEPLSTAIGEPAGTLIAPDDTLSSMIAPPLVLPIHPRPRPPSLKLRPAAFPLPAPRPLARAAPQMPDPEVTSGIHRKPEPKAASGAPPLPEPTVISHVPAMPEPKVLSGWAGSEELRPPADIGRP